MAIVDAGGDCVDPNFPIANLGNEQVALVCRTDAKVAVKVRINLGNNQSLRQWAILNHNFSAGTLDINSYTAADFVTGKVTEADDVAIRCLDMHEYITNPNSRKYWELDLTNVTTPASYFEIGRIMCHTVPVILTDMYDIRRGRGYGFKNIVNETTHGIRWVHKVYKQRESFQLTWERRKNTYIPSELKTLYDTVYGDAYPFLFIPNIDGKSCYYVSIANPELQWTTLDIGTEFTEGVQLDLIEEVRGKS